MWQSITRGFRETFGRGLNFHRNNCSNIHNEIHATKFYLYSRPPCFLGLCSRKRKEKLGTSYKNEQGPHENNEKSYGTYDAFDSWLGAVSCSSALALGWVLSQPQHWRKWFKCERTEYKKTRLLDYFVRVAVAQPTTLPPVKVAQEAIENVVYGPLTADQALNEAAEQFEEVHNTIFGKLENRQAVSLIEGPVKDASKAIRLFYSSSKKGYVPAAYNLGQCYELGVGTKQDFHEAAKWYQKAAGKGHPNATYNLAVFYAHGWGGLEANSKKARELLKVAASLGQVDAATALGLKQNKTPTQPIPDIPIECRANSQKPELPLLDVSSDPNEIYKLASSFENSPCEDSNQPHLVLQLYKMASELGHTEAKSKYKLLQAYESVGLLAEYICRGSKPTLDYCSTTRLSTLF